MGQKVHPGGFRVGVIHDWKSNWWTGKAEFADYLLEDIKIRRHILGKLSHAGLSDILIRKDKQRITVDIFTARPGIVIGKSGVEVDALRRDLHSITKKNVHININEIKRPELDAKLVAQSIAEQLENRVSFRRAMKRSLASAMRSGAQGIKITAAGRLTGGEMSRREMYSEGRVPLHTIRADIDYGQAEAKTNTGQVGVKVWINKGEIMPEGFEGAERGRTRASATRIRRGGDAARRPRASEHRGRADAGAPPTARASASSRAAGAGSAQVGARAAGPRSGRAATTCAPTRPRRRRSPWSRRPPRRPSPRRRLPRLLRRRLPRRPRRRRPRRRPRAGARARCSCRGRRSTAAITAVGAAASRRGRRPCSSATTG